MKEIQMREFLEAALGTPAIAGTHAQAAETAESLYERAISIDAMCLGAALTEELRHPPHRGQSRDLAALGHHGAFDERG